MAVAAAALETYDMKTIREDLSDAENMITPTETPFISMIIGKNEASATKHEWPVTELGSVDSSNRVAEGEDAPTVDSPVIANRRINYTQISDKVIKVSDTSQKVDTAADLNSIAKQISYKLSELKRDKETMLMANVAANPGAAVGATVRVAAGFAAFLITNASRGSGGAAPTLSASPDGYPNAAYTAGTLRDLTEDMFNLVMQACWTQGGEPKYAIVSPTNKRVISHTFTGYATKYKDADDKKIINSIDIYESDFGQVTIVPDRFSPAAAVLMIDPRHVKLSTLQPTRQIDLARTGHSQNKLIQNEYTLEVSNEKAHGIVADTNG